MSALAAAGLLLALAPVQSTPQRLAGLARVWGEVKYVHPAMATAATDWDAALVRAIPAVERAETADGYRQAVDGLLAELRDPATHVLQPGPAAPATPPATIPSPSIAVRLERLDAATAVLTVPNDPSLESVPSLQATLCDRFAEAARFDRVVVDLRAPSVRRPGWTLETAIVKCTSRLLAEDVALAPARFLTHGFYPMQSVTGGPGGGLGPWKSGVQVVAAGSLRGEAPRTPRLAFIVNAGTADVFPLLMALQAQARAVVVQQGEVRAAGLMVKTVTIDDELTVAIRHGERLRAGGGGGFVADAVVAAGDGEAARRKAVTLLEAPSDHRPAPGNVGTAFSYDAFVEKDYSEQPYPDWPHRLLALFRLYAVIEHFYPYKELMDRPWDETLVEFIPRMRAARDATDYALVVSELATRIQDSHVTLAAAVLDAYFGTHRPDIRVDLVEGATVVTEAATGVAGGGLRVGDVVLSVDGEESGARRERLGRYLPASTRGRLENKIDTQFLLGSPSQPARLEVRTPAGDVRRVSAPRTLEGLASRSRPRTGPVYTVLASGFGYVDLDRLLMADAEAAFETIRSTPGTILDMRGYPASGAQAIVPRLVRPGSHPGMLGGSMRYDGASGTFDLEESFWPIEGAAGERYAGRIAVLVDGSTQSAAEHVCGLLRSGGPVTFVGSQTSGANGGVTRTVLPGGIVVNFTGQSVRHADGSRLQRVGIVPDVEAKPTLAGVRAGRDEVLERAVEYLRGRE